MRRYLGQVIATAAFTGAWIAAAMAGPMRQPLEPNAAARLFSEFRLDGDTAEWGDRPDYFPLVPSQPGGRTGRIWVAQTEDGLAVAGEVQGPPPRWSEAEPGSGDFIEIWLADDEDALLPPLGWGHQFGFVFLESEEDCKTPEDGKPNPELEKKCIEWVRRQEVYRRSFRKLFLRSWRLSPAGAAETFASSAFALLTSDGARRLPALKPSDRVPELEIRDNGLDGTAYRFEALIAWEAFPPMRPLRIDALRLRVDVYGSGDQGPDGFSSTSPGGAPGVPRFNLVPLPAPREYFLTPCRYDPSSFQIDTGPFRGPMHASERAELYFMPQKELDLRKLIVLENRVKGYLMEPDTDTASPLAYTASFHSAALGSNRWLCWPKVTLLLEDRLTRSEYVIEADQPMEVKTLSPSRVLAKAGPVTYSSSYGSGQCGACPRMLLQIFSLHLDSGAVIGAFEIHEILEPWSGDDMDIEVSPDWRRVIVFSSEPQGDTYEPVWTETQYCLNEIVGKYRECGRRSPVPEPQPRRVKGLR